MPYSTASALSRRRRRRCCSGETNGRSPSWTSTDAGGDRPFVSPELIGTVSRRARKEPVILALRARDTIKLSDGRRIERTLDRDRIWQAQTPQGFPFGPFYRAHLRARAEGWEVTDDASIMEKAGFEVGIVEGTPENIKITAPCDREIARAIFRTMPS
ncbi:MAG TPA: 2-C-methyl-D-erythritol 4-phosphate cytidylyltransferase [bacterium]|nr:2-C-methyl-D-erythritol 4-phosphate cytidylyltransferase [bacterium]